MIGRVTTTRGILARHGFLNTDSAFTAATKLIECYPSLCDDYSWLEVIATAAIPDLALAGLVGICDVDAAALTGVWGQADWLRRLVLVLGGSSALQQHLRAHPGDVAVLREEPRCASADEVQARIAQAVGLEASQLATGVATDPQAADRLRLANKAELVRIVARDLSSQQPTDVVDGIGAELAALADAVMAGALAIARAQTPGHSQARLAIIALGKCGGQELNYLSDIDVLFVAEPAGEATQQQAMAVATKLAGATARICSAHSAAGTIWQVDAALRPEGNAGPLVRSLASHASYYAKWAKNWEFQAMLKARPMAGDAELGQQFVDMVAQRVWQVGGQQNFMSEMQAMRKRVVDHIPANQKEREIKLGSGGLRDVEFTVQLLQLVHGRVDDRLRQRGTLAALDALIAHGYIGRSDGADLAAAYRFARCLEHREQFFRLRRTHLMPADPDELRRLARQMGGNDGRQLAEDWKASKRRVLRLQQRIFFSPLLETVSRLSGESLRLSPEAADDRLRALGFGDPKAALRHIAALTTGVSRTAEIQRQLMPAMLQWFSSGPNPDLGLLSFRQLSDDMGTTSWYLRALRDESWMAERLARILSTSRYIIDLVRRDASTVQFLADPSMLQPRRLADVGESMGKAAERHESVDEQIAAVRALRRRELFRLAVGDVLGVTDMDAVGLGLSELTTATIDAALEIARAEDAEAHPDVDVAGLRIGLVAMGRWGGGEMSYASDADTMVVVDDDATSGQIAAATRIVARIRGLLRTPGADPALELDADLRPEGKNGPMVRTLSSYLKYYQKWSSIWESQALLRASVGAGDRQLMQELLDGLSYRRYPPGGISSAQATEIRRLKARMENERAGRNAQNNVKLGPGGLSDVEWTVQLLQLQHAGTIPQLRTTGTLTALTAAVEAGLVDADDACELEQAWRLASQLRNKTMLVRGKAFNLLPTDARELAAVAMLLGHGPGEASGLQERYHKSARHAARVVDKLFWGRG